MCKEIAPGAVRKGERKGNKRRGAPRAKFDAILLFNHAKTPRTNIAAMPPVIVTINEVNATNPPLCARSPITCIPFTWSGVKPKGHFWVCANDFLQDIFYLGSPVPRPADNRRIFCLRACVDTKVSTDDRQIEYACLSIQCTHTSAPAS